MYKMRVEGVQTLNSLPWTERVESRTLALLANVNYTEKVIRLSGGMLGSVQ